MYLLTSRSCHASLYLYSSLYNFKVIHLTEEESLQVCRRSYEKTFGRLEMEQASLPTVKPGFHLVSIAQRSLQPILRQQDTLLPVS